MARISKTGNRQAGSIGARAAPKLKASGYTLRNSGVPVTWSAISPDGEVLIENASRDKAIEAASIHLNRSSPE